MNVQFEEQPSIEDIAWALLDASGIKEPPTNPEILADYLGLTIIPFDPQKLAEDVDAEPDVVGDIRALLVPRKKQIRINKALDPKRRRFSILHEIGHFVLPGHASESDLRHHAIPIGSASASEVTTDALIAKEQEASQFAAACLFQVERFDQMIANSQFGWHTILNLAKIFDASIESTARRYVERQNRNCALVIFRPTGPFDQFNRPPLSLEYTIASPHFGDRYFRNLRRDQPIEAGNPAYQFFYTQYGNETLDVTLMVRSAGADRSLTFEASFFSNHYKLMALLKPTAAADFDGI